MCVCLCVAVCGCVGVWGVWIGMCGCVGRYVWVCGWVWMGMWFIMFILARRIRVAFLPTWNYASHSLIDLNTHDSTARRYEVYKEIFASTAHTLHFEKKIKCKVLEKQK